MLVITRFTDEAVIIDERIRVVLRSIGEQSAAVELTAADPFLLFPDCLEALCRPPIRTAAYRCSLDMGAGICVDEQFTIVLYAIKTVATPAYMPESALRAHQTPV